MSGTTEVAYDPIEDAAFIASLAADQRKLLEFPWFNGGSTAAEPLPRGGTGMICEQLDREQPEPARWRGWAVCPVCEHTVPCTSLGGLWSHDAETWLYASGLG